MDLYIDDLKMVEYVEPEPEVPAAGEKMFWKVLARPEREPIE